MWSNDVEALANEVENWAKQSGIQTQRHSIKAGEPLLSLTTAHGKVHLEPAEFSEGRVPTVVFLYAQPTLRQVRLVGPGAGHAWEARTGQDVPLYMGWNKQAFLRLISDLLA